MKQLAAILITLLHPLTISSSDQTYKANYEGKSKSFAQYLTWTNEKIKTFERITEIIGNKQHALLDIGAGDGTIAKQLASYFESITVVEPSPALFKTLQKNCTNSKYTLLNAPFEQTNWNQVESFDIILISFALQYIPNYEQELQRIKNLLSNNGKLIVVSFDHTQSDIYPFYQKHIASILEHEAPELNFANFEEVLKKHFSVEIVPLMTTVTIPNSAAAISIADFIFDTGWERSKKTPFPSSNKI